MSADVNPLYLTVFPAGGDYSSRPMAASVDPRFIRTCKIGQNVPISVPSEQKQWNHGNSIYQGATKCPSAINAMLENNHGNTKQ